MKRKEQIENYAYNNCINDDIDDTSYSLIVETAKWADETIMEKMCAWLENIIFEIEYMYNDNGHTFFDKEKFINDFRKKMEG